MPPKSIKSSPHFLLSLLFCYLTAESCTSRTFQCSHNESQAKYAVFLFIHLHYCSFINSENRKNKIQRGKKSTLSFPAEFKMFLILSLIVSFSFCKNLHVNEHAFNYRKYLSPNSLCQEFYPRSYIKKNKRNQKPPFLNIGFFPRCVKTMDNVYYFLQFPAK